MNDAKCAEAVLRWVTYEFQQAQNDLEELKYEEIGRDAQKREWDRNNPDDGVGSFSLNPYRETDRSRADMEALKKNVEDWTAIRDFIINRVCACIDTPKRDIPPSHKLVDATFIHPDMGVGFDVAEVHNGIATMRRFEFVEINRLVETWERHTEFDGVIQNAEKSVHDQA